MVARRRLTATLVAGSFASIGAFVLVSAPAAAADSVCPATLLPGQVCTTVDTVVDTLVGTTATTAPATTDTTSPSTTVAPAPAPAPTADPSTLLEPVQQIPLLPAPTSPVPAPSTPPSNEGTAPAPSTSPGAGAASPASHPAATNTFSTPAASTRPSVSPIVNSGETARSFDLPTVGAASATPFVLDPAPVPSATQYGTSQLAAAGLPDGNDHGGPSLPRPTGPLTLAVLLVAGVLGAHGVRWVDKATATAGR